MGNRPQSFLFVNKLRETCITTDVGFGTHLVQVFKQTNFVADFLWKKSTFIRESVISRFLTSIPISYRRSDKIGGFEIDEKFVGIRRHRVELSFTQRHSTSSMDSVPSSSSSSLVVVVSIERMCRLFLRLCPFRLISVVKQYWRAFSFEFFINSVV